MTLVLDFPSFGAKPTISLTLIDAWFALSAATPFAVGLNVSVTVPLVFSVLLLA